MQSRSDRRITHFVEKPKDESLLDGMQMSKELLGATGSDEGEELYQASMGIYLFNRQVLVECLANDWSTSVSILFLTRSRTGMSALTFSKAIGKTSERFALSMKRTWI